MPSFEIKEKRSYYACVSNNLIEKSSNIFTVAENKAILFAIAKIKPNTKYDYENEENNYINFSIKEYCEVMGMNYNSGKNYSDIKKAFLGLTKTFFVDVNDKHQTMVRWIDDGDLYTDENNFRYKFNKKIAPYIYELSKDKTYTKLQLFYQIAFTCRYTFKIYQLCKRYIFKNKYIIDYEDLRKLLGIKKQYEEFKHFNMYVLKPIAEDINKVSDINVKIEFVKELKKVKEIIFNVSKKSDDELEIVNKDFYTLINKINKISKEQEALERKGKRDELDCKSNQ